MRLLVQVGRRHQALRNYRTLRAALQRELEVEPDASVQALYQAVRVGRTVRLEPPQSRGRAGVRHQGVQAPRCPACTCGDKE